MTPQEQIEIIQAYERGEEIEYTSISIEGWIPVLPRKEFLEKFGYEHNFNFQENKYRIKQKPKRWRADIGCNYFCINGFGEINQITQIDGDSDAQLYKIGNYFQTKDQAIRVKELIKELFIKAHEL